MPVRTALLFLVGVLVTPALLAQQHGYTPQDIENGGQIYQTSCATCHGPEGDGIAGVNLGSGKFRRASTDDELVRIIIGGIPGTAMPPSNYSEGQAGTIVAYVRSLAASPAGTTIPGDAARGKAIFEGKGQCLTCHSVGGVGARVARRSPKSARCGEPSIFSARSSSLRAEVRSDNRSVRIVTRQGETITGTSAQSGHIHHSAARRERASAARGQVDACVSTRFSEARRCHRIEEARRAGTGRSRQLPDDPQGTTMIAARRCVVAGARDLDCSPARCCGPRSHSSGFCARSRPRRIGSTYSGGC